MKTLIVGNHKNEWLVEGAKHFARKHLPNLDLATCYTPDDVQCWSESVGRFVEMMDEDYVLLLLDDYWIQEVDVWLYNLAVEVLEGHKDIAKIDLSGDRVKFKHERVSEYFIESAPESAYRSSLQAAIWRKDYLLKFCQKGWSPWEFELKGNQKAFNDGAMILGTVKPCIRYINVLRRGEWYGKFDF